MMEKQEKIWNREYLEKGRLWSRETINLPRALKGRRILELGAGNGKTLKSILKQKPDSVIAIDFSSEAIRQCKTLFPICRHLTLLNANILNLPFNTNDFDVIVCYYILNNLLKKERQRAVKEIYRVLKPKGKIIFEDFAVGDFRQDKQAKTIEPNTIRKKNGIICHFFTKAEIKSLFGPFKNLKIKESNSMPIKHKPLERKIISAVIDK